MAIRQTVAGKLEKVERVLVEGSPLSGVGGVQKKGLSLENLEGFS